MWCVRHNMLGVFHWCLHTCHNIHLRMLRAHTSSSVACLQPAALLFLPFSPGDTGHRPPQPTGPSSLAEQAAALGGAEHHSAGVDQGSSWGGGVGLAVHMEITAQD